MIKLRNLVTLYFFLLLIIRVEVISAACGCASSCTPQCSAFGTDTCTSDCTATGGSTCDCTSSCTFECNTWVDDTCTSTCKSADLSGSVPTEFILSAYNFANIGDIIEIEPGSVFAPTTSISGEGDNAIAITKAVTIKCLDLVSRCELNGRGDKRVMYINSGTTSTTTLIGLKVTKGDVRKAKKIMISQNTCKLKQ